MFVLHPSAKVRFAQERIAPGAIHFTHRVAARVREQVLRKDAAKRIVIDLHEAEDAETSAFAELILLRRSLLRGGRDLRLTGLRERAAGVYEVNKLAEVLPVE
ncbi:MAG: hypothetical protein ACAI43_00840 [Phycisphaerae bacterium]|nr:hypothetical protein [Tepidisphaeraceae bacterium]